MAPRLCQQEACWEAGRSCEACWEAGRSCWEAGQAVPHLAAFSPRGGPGSLAEPAGKAGLTMLNFLLCTCQLEPCRV